jgi:hypothetical protein
LYYLSNINDEYAKLLVDDAAVYWKNNDSSSNGVSIERIPLDGSTPQKLYVSYRKIYALTTDGNNIYWLENTGSGAPYEEAKLVRINKSGGLPETVCEGISRPLDSPSIIFAANSIFVGTDGELLKIPARGGAPTVLAEGTKIMPYRIVMYQGSVYWLNFDRFGGPRHDGETSLQSMPADGGSITVIAVTGKNPTNLVVTSSGLYWTEDEPPYNAFYGMYRMLKKYSWHNGVIDTLANGIFFSSFDIAGNYIYCTEYARSIEYAEIARIPLSGGIPEPLIGGLNTANPIALYATPSLLLIGDDASLKTVPIVGGVTKTLLTNGRFKIADIKEQNGTVFFSSRGDSNGIYKVSLVSGSYDALSGEVGLYGAIVSVEDSYVYYVFGQSNNSGGVNQELRRVPINGGVAESVFKVPDGLLLVAFDGLGTVYLSEWIWNDQYKLIKYDIASGESVTIMSGSYSFRGVNSTSIFVTDSIGTIYRIPKNGGKSTRILSVPYPLTIGPYWVKSGENFYFSISYFDESQGDFTEIDFLEQLN